MTRNLFNFCDLLCKYAETPKEEGIDGSGSCHTFIALYCTKRNLLFTRTCHARINVQKPVKSKKVKSKKTFFDLLFISYF